MSAARHADAPGRVTGRRCGLPRRDDGSTSLELAIAFPVVLLLITGLMQFGLWFFARTVALAAAQEGVTAARVLGADPADGVARGLDYVAANGSDTLLDAVVTASSPAVGTVAVQVSGRSLSVLPGVVGIPVSQSAVGPVERFTEAGDP